MRRPRSLFALALMAALLGTLVTACGSGMAKNKARVLRVPSKFATIDAAVNKAKPGDIVLVAPGTYHESVKIYRPGITVRGEDRNTVILDGQDTLANGFLVAANDVAIENVTVHSYTQNGVMFSGIEAVTEGKGADPDVVYGMGDNVLSNYRVSYVTSYNNGLYGIYAFASRGGIIEHSYVSGHPDSGFYIGQCKPCDVVLRDITAEYNSIGYYGTNSSGGVYVIESVFRHNRLGIAPNSQKAEMLSPQGETVVAGNLVTDNVEANAPEIVHGFAGGGIAIGGGERNTVLRNRVSNHSTFGIMVLDLNEFLPTNNRVEGNVLERNGVDLGYAPVGAADAAGNCFTGNTFVSSLPVDIEQVMPCGKPATLTQVPVFQSPAAPPGPDYHDVPAPGSQPTMPDTAMSALGGAGTLDLVVDLAKIVVPAA